MNPAVTLAFWRLGKISTFDAVGYIVGQFVGAALMVGLVSLVAGKAYSHPAIDFAQTKPGPGGVPVAFAIEFAITFVLMMLILWASNDGAAGEEAAPLRLPSDRVLPDARDALHRDEPEPRAQHRLGALRPLVPLPLALLRRADRRDPSRRRTVRPPLAQPARRPLLSSRTEMSNEPYPSSEAFKGQKLPYPAKQSEMDPPPDSDLSRYRPAGKLEEKVALITGADSGIGRAVAIAYAMEGADVAILYNENDDDAAETKRLVEEKGRKCLVLKHDVRDAAQCREAVSKTVEELGRLNILVNNAAYQQSQKRFEDITEEQLRRTFDTNILGYFFMAQAALPHMTAGACIINTGSIVGMTGLAILIDYTATKGAIHAFTKSLALSLGERKIRVNCVVPGAGVDAEHSGDDAHRGGRELRPRGDLGASRANPRSWLPPTSSSPRRAIRAS